ncbi:DUF397 domain-containing protein [Actinomadura fibrosa]|uniref:DUF397 domain-containing protein n=1 Tax=Actinomadura fibrosa TaxID=111802 RepID=A0ABW2XEJ3_9ACTN|nr:DUF397 domain-containing protein [Actinomadura fibrosa]
MSVRWRKSSYSGGTSQSDCVEVARLAGGVGVRDSKAPGAGHVVIGAAGLAGLFGLIKAGCLDVQ